MGYQGGSSGFLVGYQRVSRRFPSGLAVGYQGVSSGFLVQWGGFQLSGGFQWVTRGFRVTSEGFPLFRASSGLPGPKAIVGHLLFSHARRILVALALETPGPQAKHVSPSRREKVAAPEKNGEALLRRPPAMVTFL